MFCVRIQSNNLDKRLDAGFYNPDYLTAQRKVNGFALATLEALRESTSSIGYGVVKPRIQESDVRMVRIQNFEDPFVDIESAVAIDPAQMIEFRRSSCSPGDILVAIGGYPGRLGILPEFPSGVSAVNINQHVVRVRLGNKIDRTYVVAYLMSEFGRKLLARQVSGSVQAGINVEDFRLITVPVIASLAQQYIGDKIRQAERLRAWGKARYSLASTLFEEAVRRLGYVPQASKQSVWTKLGSRLDPAYYNPKYSFFDESWFINNNRPLSTFIEDGAYGVLPDSNSYGSGKEKFIRATDLKLSNIDPTAFTFVPSDQVASKAKIKTNDILLEIKGAIESCELAGEELAGTYVNGSIFRFSPKNIKPGYLAFYLRSFIKQLYCERVSVNNIISYLDLGSINSLPVLGLGDENEAEIEQCFLQQLDAARLSFRLTTAAKFIVEAVIEGQLDESLLKAAQVLLESGNDSIDRSILNRLKTDGMDGSGEPLFADLDELYRLLAQAQEY